MFTASFSQLLSETQCFLFICWTCILASSSALSLGWSPVSIETASLTLPYELVSLCCISWLWKDISLLQALNYRKRCNWFPQCNSNLNESRIRLWRDYREQVIVQRLLRRGFNETEVHGALDGKRMQSVEVSRGDRTILIPLMQKQQCP